MTIPKRHVELVQIRTLPSEVIGQYVPLKPRGRKDRREWIGLCPFSQENTPSFTVTDRKGFYFCIGCGAWGTVLTFLQRYVGMSFQQAVLHLAETHKIKLPSGATKVTRKKIKDRKRRAKVLAKKEEKERARLLADSF